MQKKGVLDHNSRPCWTMTYPFSNMFFASSSLAVWFIYFLSSISRFSLLSLSLYISLFSLLFLLFLFQLSQISFLDLLPFLSCISFLFFIFSFLFWTPNHSLVCVCYCVFVWGVLVFSWFAKTTTKGQKIVLRENSVWGFVSGSPWGEKGLKGPPLKS